MAHYLREQIAERLCQVVPLVESQLSSWSELAAKVPWALRFHPVAKQRQKTKERPHMVLDYSHLQNLWAPYGLQMTQVQEWAHASTKQIQGDPLFAHISTRDHKIEFEVEHKTFVKGCLHAILNDKSYGFSSGLHHYTKNKEGSWVPHKSHQTIVLEYSSPNIAKPFHAGHLRSTILGNIFGNLYERLGHKVVRINYLGNCGTQFGLLAEGYNRYGKSDELKHNPLKHLLEIYICINKEAQEDDTIMKAARRLSTQMEEGEESAMALWKKFMEESMKEYKRIYQRLDIRFDEYDGEAEQVNKARCLIKQLENDSLLKYKDGVGYIELLNDVGEPIKVNLVREDGSTLYLSRDIVAAIDRYKKYKFDRLLYFVERGQQHHFENLFRTLQLLSHNWAKTDHDDLHIKFGRIQGMSTRSGNVVLLQDLLDTATHTMLHNMHDTQTTKYTCNEEKTAEILAKSGLIIQDVKQRRILNYEFSWSRMLRSKGDTGVALQYAHARLANIEKNCGMDVDVDCSLEVLVEPAAVNLVCHLARYDEVLNKMLSDLEPYHLVIYLFMLIRVVYVCIGELYVKGEPDIEKAEARLLLYHCARLVLASGLHTLGIQPLDEF